MLEGRLHLSWLIRGVVRQNSEILQHLRPLLDVLDVLSRVEKSRSENQIEILLEERHVHRFNEFDSSVAYDISGVDFHEVEFRPQVFRHSHLLPTVFVRHFGLSQSIDLANENLEVKLLSDRQRTFFFQN